MQVDFDVYPPLVVPSTLTGAVEPVAVYVDLEITCEGHDYEFSPVTRYYEDEATGLIKKFFESVNALAGEDITKDAYKDIKKYRYIYMAIYYARTKLELEAVKDSLFFTIRRDQLAKHDPELLKLINAYKIKQQALTA